jgi:putative ABC transport system permease protein
VLRDQYASDKGFEVGDTLRVEGSNGVTRRFGVVATTDDKSGFFGNILLPYRVLHDKFGETQDNTDLVRVSPGVSVDRVQRRIDRLLEDDYPTVDSTNREEFKNKIAKQIDQSLVLVYALLSLSVIVSLFGIVNALVLSITERTRELGMMRAIGTTRRQVRRIVRYEAVITAVIGGVLGLVIGLALACLTSVALEDEGLQLFVPVGQLVVFLIVAAIAGVVAAIPPARRAARTDMLKAIAYE